MGVGFTGCTIPAQKVLPSEPIGLNMAMVGLGGGVRGSGLFCALLSFRVVGRGLSARVHVPPNFSIANQLMELYAFVFFFRVNFKSAIIMASIRAFAKHWRPRTMKEAANAALFAAIATSET